MKNKKLFAEYMATLSVIYDKEITKPLTDIYWKTLEPFSDEQCEAAFRNIIATCKFFPKPAELLENIRGTTENRSAKAWIKVVRAIKGIGNYASVKFDDPVIHSVLEFMGGWDKIWDWQTSEMVWKQKEFERLYGIMESKLDHPLYLEGLAEKENIEKGLSKFNKPPIRIAETKTRDIKFIEPPKTLH